MPIRENLANVGTVHGGDDAHPAVKSRNQEDDRHDFGAALAAMLYAPAAAPPLSHSASRAKADNAAAPSAIDRSSSRLNNSSGIQNNLHDVQPGSADTVASFAPEPRSGLRGTAERFSALQHYAPAPTDQPASGVAAAAVSAADNSTLDQFSTARRSTDPANPAHAVLAAETPSPAIAAQSVATAGTTEPTTALKARREPAATITGSTKSDNSTDAKAPESMTARPSPAADPITPGGVDPRAAKPDRRNSPANSAGTVQRGSTESIIRSTHPTQHATTPVTPAATTSAAAPSAPSPEPLAAGHQTYLSAAKPDLANVAQPRVVETPTAAPRVVPAAAVRLTTTPPPPAPAQRTTTLRIDLAQGASAHASVRERAGSVEVRIVTDNLPVARRLNNEIGALRRALDASGMNLHSADVSYRGEGGGGGRDRGADPQTPRRDPTDSKIPFTLNEVIE